MPTEFVVRLNEDTYGKRQELPSAYDDFCYNGNKHVYLTSQERVRYRVQLVKPNGGTTELRGEKWKKFCVAYIPKGAYLLHFVQEGDDSFYVTSYDDLGYETGGYEGIIGRPCRFMCRVSPSDNIPQFDMEKRGYEGYRLRINQSKIEAEIHTLHDGGLLMQLDGNRRIGRSS
ncbi:acetyl-CoA carboxylase 2 [Artemisia annua]|uniref:Acetyl-CoA carboxylase 2 n=1 Tax=Artemisia annua TaxID=35608 RepID=A0A2U1LX33_ARTAN|nr:acetyl-CoA carboxylase 2 [Artemisia annua]